MATKQPTGRTNHGQSMVERCERCGRETDHRVAIEIRTESTKPENARFSREPYRVTECQACGRRHSQRMNNA